MPQDRRALGRPCLSLLQPPLLRLTPYCNIGYYLFGMIQGLRDGFVAVGVSRTVLRQVLVWDGHSVGQGH